MEVTPFLLTETAHCEGAEQRIAVVETKRKGGHMSLCESENCGGEDPEELK